MKNQILLLPVIFLIATLKTVAQPQWKNEKLVIENDKIKHIIQLEKGKIITTFFSKELKKELLFATATTPWFEFSVNGKLVKANDETWKFVQLAHRKMSNGGTEVNLAFQHTKIKGLQVTILRQFFPNSALIREQLTLQNVGKTALQLTKHNKQLHFKFPQYEWTNDLPQNKLKEIRIATFGKEQLENFDKNATYDDRAFDNGYFFNLTHTHSFHPDVRYYNLGSNQNIAVKGSMQFLDMNEYRLFSAYEHASQDSRVGFHKEDGSKVSKQPNSSITVDAAQGVEGESGLEESDADFWFLALNNIKKAQQITTSTEILRGGYLDGEAITNQKPYTSVWTALAAVPTSTVEKQFLHDYLWFQITEHLVSRKQHFYYNTWGMQRDSSRNGDALRNIFTESRISQEIDFAAQLGVDIFVLDDGWEQTQGIWQAHSTRLPNGLKPFVERMKKYDITPGIWLSPMGIDSTTERYQQHKNWIIKDKNGKPIKAQWGHPAFDFVSDFYDLFVADCKKLIDEGFLFFKWDAINTFNSTLLDLHHGDSRYTPQEIKERYDYLLPFYVTKAIKELREYNPDVVVELDVTEPERCLVGLMPLQESKFFWMNNGASGYGDYSTYRTKSMRTTLHQYDSIFPTGLFTFAVYPHNLYPFFAQRYNVNTTLIAGKGFWGNLLSTTETQRLRIGKTIAKHKRILPYINNLPTEIQGKIGTSPEIFMQINRKTAAGQVIAFSGAVTEYNYKTTFSAENCLAILHHKYEIEGNTIKIPFQFSMPDDTREVFILPNDNTRINIISSTGWLEDVVLAEKQMSISTGTATYLVLRIPYSNVKMNDEPLESAANGLFYVYVPNAEKVVFTWE